MRVRDIMTQPATTCAPETTIAIAGHLMEDAGVGILPVVDLRRRLVGVVTDRDLLLTLANTDRAAAQVTVGEAMQSDVTTCAADDDLKIAVDAMRRSAVRRLPVIDRDWHVIGILSVDDIVRWGVVPDGVRAAYVIGALEQICERGTMRTELAEKTIYRGATALTENPLSRL
jgi:CBS domain-containing protein